MWDLLNVFTCLDFYVKEKILATDFSTQFLQSISKNDKVALSPISC